MQQIGLKIIEFDFNHVKPALFQSKKWVMILPKSNVVQHEHRTTMLFYEHMKSGTNEGEYWQAPQGDAILTRVCKVTTYAVPHFSWTAAPTTNTAAAVSSFPQSRLSHNHGGQR